MSMGFGDFSISIKLKDGTTKELKLGLYDLNKNGKIDQDEWYKILENYGDSLPDNFNLQSLDSITVDRELDENELKKWEQEEKIDEYFEDFKATIAQDFAGSTKIGRVTDELKAFKNEFKAGYNKDNYNTMFNDFVAAFTVKYDEIKKGINDSQIKQKAVDTVMETLMSKYDLSMADKTRINTALIAEADRYLQDHPDAANSEERIVAHLNEYLQDVVSTDSEIDEANNRWNSTAAAALGDNMLTADEIDDLKYEAIHYVTTLINKGYVIKVDGESQSISQLTNMINAFQNGQTLISFINGIVAAQEKVPVTTNEDLLIQNLTQPELEINASAPNSYDRTIDNVIGDILDKYNIKQYDQDFRVLIGDVLLSEAYRFLNELFDGLEDEFEEALTAHLEHYIEGRYNEVEAGRAEWQSRLNDIDISYPSQDDYNALVDLLTDIWNKAAAADIQFVDASGNPLDLESIKGNYDRNSLIEFKNFIQRLINSLDCIDRNLIDVYKKNHDGILKVVPGEELGMDLNDIDYGNLWPSYTSPYQQTNNEDLRKKINRQIRSQLINKAKRMCETLGITMTPGYAYQIENIYDRATEKFIPKRKPYSNTPATMSHYNERDLANKIANKFKTDVTRWAHRVAGK